jgi:hypothetical protein
MYDNAEETNYMKTSIFIAWLTLVTALTISGVAIYYSVSGLAAIFSAAVIPIIIMGGVLEVSKLVTAVWLHRYWGIATWWLKTYLSIAVLVLMLITSIGIFGFLSKAHDTASGNATEAIATVQRIDGQIAREENRIEILEDRIAGLNSGDGFDVSGSITQQQEIIAGARGAVQADIDYNQTQITAINERLDRDLEALETSLTADIQVQTDKLVPLDELVASYRDEEDSGFINRTDNRGEAERVLQEQKPERDAIATEITRLRDSARDRESELRREASVAVREAQGNINDYRAQTQDTVDAATAEINRLRQQSNSSQDDDLEQIDEWNLTIDGIYNTIDSLRDEKFESEQAVRLVESEVGPIRYIAEFFTGTEDADASLLETAVSWLIMVIIFVFDPLAVLLLIASQYTFEQRRKEDPSLEKPEPPEEPDPQPLGEGFDMDPFGMADQLIEDDEVEEDYKAMKEDIQSSPPSAVDDAANIMSGFDLDFTKLEPSIAEAKEAFENWELSKFHKKLEEEVSVENDQVLEPVPEPVVKSPITTNPEFQAKIDETKKAFKEYEGNKKVEEEEKVVDAPRVSQGVTYEKIRDSEYYIDPEGKQIHENALKAQHPNLFLQADSGARQAGTSFGTAFPMIAVKGDIFVRVDQMPNRVYKFEGKDWMEIDKDYSDSYTFDEEYIKYIIAQIKTGEYDIDLLSEAERHQVEIYLTKTDG